MTHKMLRTSFLIVVSKIIR